MWTVCLLCGAALFNILCAELDCSKTSGRPLTPISDTPTYCYGGVSCTHDESIHEIAFVQPKVFSRRYDPAENSVERGGDRYSCVFLVWVNHLMIAIDLEKAAYTGAVCVCVCWWWRDTLPPQFPLRMMYWDEPQWTDRHLKAALCTWRRRNSCRWINIFWIYDIIFCWWMSV